MSDAPEPEPGPVQPMEPWKRGLIAIAVILGLGGFSQLSARPLEIRTQSGTTATPTVVRFNAPPLIVFTPTRVVLPTRRPTQLPDGGSNKNGDMCTVVESEHAARPNVPLCHN